MIAVECRQGDDSTLRLFAALEHAPTRTCVDAERAMNLCLHGSCHVPVAGYAVLDAGELDLQGLVGDAASGRVVRARERGDARDPKAVGRRVAEALIAQGAGAMLGHPS